MTRRLANMNQEKYPRSSIEDDFNYGTNVATASVHIRMGEFEIVLRTSWLNELAVAILPTGESNLRPARLAKQIATVSFNRETQVV